MPILDSSALDFVSRSPEQTRRMGIRLGALMQPGDLICLQGDLGSGKTTLVQGIAQGWGSLDPVTSPTFVLVNVYQRPDGHSLFHLDAFRLNSATEAEDLDLDALNESGALVVEWAEKIKAALQPESLWIHMRYVDEVQRGMIITPHGDRYIHLLKEFRRQAFGG
ncbi:MAG: tRNA (adenosine(37)-N6)-threonylcarbamoyltransferase complex ATPase subunit type 1 TsaE [Anaerolineae bacterium]|nr:tRNA (adenosine(37)-N6)-threonylcarbamoyltransferase complex ATPase subunit type 1 TsaE [Anaerolineae bacterium]